MKKNKEAKENLQNEKSKNLKKLNIWKILEENISATKIDKISKSENEKISQTFSLFSPANGPSWRLNRPASNQVVDTTVETHPWAYPTLFRSAESISCWVPAKENNRRRRICHRPSFLSLQTSTSAAEMRRVIWKDL